MSNSDASLPDESPGQWLTRQLERRSISVRQFADAMQVTTQTVYAWQNNRTVIAEDRVPLLAKALGVSEIEARRGLGFWVPDSSESTAPARDAAELEEIIADLTGVLDRFRRWRREG